MPAWKWFVKNFMRFGDRLSGHNMFSRLDFLEKVQWWNQEQIREYQQQTLQSLIAVAYNEVPFYRQLMDDSKIKPEEIRKPSDLRKLPILTKDVIRSNYPGKITRDTGHKTYESRTSGSTGKNFCVLEDYATAGWYRASFLLALEWAGWIIGDPHLQTGMTLDRSFDKKLKDWFLRCYYVSAFDISDEKLDSSLELLRKNKIKHLWGYPGSIFFLARRALQKGWDQPLQSVVTWGDNLYPQYRKTIEKAFNTKVYDTYGCAEGIQISAQCGCGSTYHIHGLDTIVEFLDDHGNPAADNEQGNIILTRLYPGPMPLIRYKVGDIGIHGLKRKCECGRGFDLMESIQGRDTDIVITPSGNRLIVHFFTGIFEFFDEIDSFQVVQETIDSIVVRIKPKGNFFKQTAEQVIAALRQKGADLKIEIEIVSEIPLAATGKRTFVISKLGSVYKQQDAPAAEVQKRK